MANVKTANFKSWIDKIMKNEEVENYELKIEANTLKGDGYSSEITFVNVKTTTKDYNFVLKYDLKNEQVRQRFSTSKIFFQENLVYGKIFPIFEEFQLKNSVQKPFKNYAQYYEVCDEQKGYLVVLENLKAKGFELHNRENPMNLAHIQFVFVQYARFHAVSMAMKRLQSGLFRTITSDVENILEKSITLSDMVSVLTKYMSRGLKLLRPIVAEKFQRYESDIEDIFLKTTYDPEDPITVVLHADCWNSNMMFKYDKGDKTKPTDVRFLDFQMSRVGHPILDLSYFLYACCDKEILENFDFLLELYHSTLSDSLSDYGIDVNTFFPLTKLRGDWRKFSIFGLSMALLVIEIELFDSSEAQEFKEAADNDQLVMIEDSLQATMKNDERYNERVRAILEHFCATFL